MKLYNRIFGINEITAQEVIQQFQQQEVYETQQGQRQQEQQEQQGQNTPSEGVMAQMTFTLQENGDVGILFDWKNHSKTLAKYFGDFLFYLNDGQMATNIHNILVSYAKKGLVKTRFVEQIFKSWDKKEESVNKTPIIPPSKVLSKMPSPTVNQTFEEPE